MVKITFMGAGSTVFAKNVLGDCMLTPALKGLEIALYDIDGKRLEESRRMLEAINATGVGPAGTGGRVTALAVHIDYYPTHIAGLPVAVNMCCHAARHAQAIL